MPRAIEWSGRRIRQELKKSTALFPSPGDENCGVLVKGNRKVWPGLDARFSNRNAWAWWKALTAKTVGLVCQFKSVTGEGPVWQCQRPTKTHADISSGCPNGAGPRDEKSRSLEEERRNTTAGAQSRNPRAEMPLRPSWKARKSKPTHRRNTLSG